METVGHVYADTRMRTHA